MDNSPYQRFLSVTKACAGETAATRHLVTLSGHAYRHRPGPVRVLAELGEHQAAAEQGVP